MLLDELCIFGHLNDNIHFILSDSEIFAEMEAFVYV